MSNGCFAKPTQKTSIMMCFELPICNKVPTNA